MASCVKQVFVALGFGHRTFVLYDQGDGIRGNEVMNKILQAQRVVVACDVRDVLEYVSVCAVGIVQ